MDTPGAAQVVLHRWVCRSAGCVELGWLQPAQHTRLFL